MVLNCSKVIDEFNNLYSGICLYSENDFSHSFNERGGNIPETKSHLVIDKPESVNLVNPPMIIIKATRKVINNNQ
jgi:hypothetical protein